jgi:hypothetical protein
MAQAGFTPIQLYYSTTTTNVPTSGNLADGELAINITDGKLFYKDNGGVVQTIATKNAVTNVASISFGSTGLTPSTATTGAVTVAGTLAATSGGTGQSSYAVGDLVYASTTTALSKLADVATGNALISGGVGVAPAYGKIGLATHVSGTLPVANGGTGLTTYVVGDIVYASAAGTLASLADVATGNALISGGVGVAPSYGKIGLTTHVSGTLGVANGGTGLASYTTNHIPYASGATTLTTSSSLTFNGSTLTVSGIGFGLGNASIAGNIAIGAGNTLNSNSTGSDNIAIGANVLPISTTASSNIAVGTNALETLSTGSDNIVIGTSAATTLETGSNNTVIGASANVSSVSVSDEIVIGRATTGKGTQTAFIGGTSGAYNAKNVTTWETTSDERIKCNIVDSPKGLAEVKQLRVRNFNYKQVEDMPLNAQGKPIIDNLDPNRLITGFIAQELQAVMPECVNTTASGLLSVSSDAVIYALVKAVQELAAEVEALKG